MELEYSQARDRDAADELGHFKERFVPAKDNAMVAYLDGHSLGRPPESTVERVTEFLRQDWGTRLVRGWNDEWLDLPVVAGDRLGQVALGAAPGQVIMADSTTVCLYKMIRVAVSGRQGRTEIVTDDGNFPTDRYVVEGVAEELGMRVRWLEADPVHGVSAQQVADAVGPDTAVLTLSHSDYRSACLADMGEITRLVHEAGGLVVWDICHSVGCVPIDLDALGVDFAVGCTYKYLNSGPGSPAFMYVRSEHQDLVQPIYGWLGHRDPFVMGPGFKPADGMRRFLSSSPSVFGMLAVSESAQMLAEAGIKRIREKSIALSEMCIQLTDERLADLGFSVASPRDPQRRGGHVTLRHRDAEQLTERLLEAGVIVDYRGPDGIRLGLSPLSTSFAELWSAMDTIREVASS